jgi:hypothetical protein
MSGELELDTSKFGRTYLDAAKSELVKKEQQSNVSVSVAADKSYMKPMT